MCMYINLCFQDICRTQKENIFAQSTLSAELWGNFVEVMNLYEDGELKDQNKCGEVKQHHFQPICRLLVVTQQDLLQLLIDKCGNWFIIIIDITYHSLFIVYLYIPCAHVL